jgi:hypothetical protein
VVFFKKSGRVKVYFFRFPKNLKLNFSKNRFSTCHFVGQKKVA